MQLRTLLACIAISCGSGLAYSKDTANSKSNCNRLVADSKNHLSTTWQSLADEIPAASFWLYSNGLATLESNFFSSGSAIRHFQYFMSGRKTEITFLPCFTHYENFIEVEKERLGVGVNAIDAKTLAITYDISQGHLLFNNTYFREVGDLAAARPDSNGYDTATIRLTDIPPDAP